MVPRQKVAQHQQVILDLVGEAVSQSVIPHQGLAPLVQSLLLGPTCVVGPRINQTLGCGMDIIALDEELAEIKAHIHDVWGTITSLERA